MILGFFVTLVVTLDSSLCALINIIPLSFVRQGYITRLDDNNLKYRVATREMCSLLEYFVTLLSFFNDER